MTHAERCAGKIEANIRKIAYSGYTDIQGSKIITEITAIIQTAIDDEKAELKGDCDKLEIALRKLLKSTGHCLVSTKTAITIDDLIPQVLEVAQDLSLVGRCEAQSQQIADLTAEIDRLREALQDIVNIRDMPLNYASNYEDYWAEALQYADQALSQPKTEEKNDE